MCVTKCHLPATTAIDSAMLQGSFYADAYCVPLVRGELSVADIFIAVFGHYPGWIKALLLARLRLGALFGLRAAHTSDLLQPIQASSYCVGQKIGRWPIHHLSERELVAGINDRHLDFRVSVLRHESAQGTFAMISTVCRTHNWFGRLYLRIITPFHSWGVRHLMSRASRARRL